MARPKREMQRQSTADEIKATARQQMSENGTAGISLRAIAREMGITAPAIYNYFPRLDDLITALIVDAFNALADFMEAAADEEDSPTNAPKIRATLIAYRQWVLDYPTEFQLIYGNPIPNYQAPAEVTVPLARRPFEKLIRLTIEALMQGELTIPKEYEHIPESVEQYVTKWTVQGDFHFPEPLFYVMIAGWTRIHGVVMLELFHHLTPVVGDSDAFYNHEVDLFMKQLGM